jgi:hypothetical protein
MPSEISEKKTIATDVTLFESSGGFMAKLMLNPIDLGSPFPYLLRRELTCPQAKILDI